jgi:hypothetical protein
MGVGTDQGSGAVMGVETTSGYLSRVAWVVVSSLRNFASVNLRYTHCSYHSHVIGVFFFAFRSIKLHLEYQALTGDVGMIAVATVMMIGRG